MPYVDKFQLHIYAVLAEQEREFICIRTKQTLQTAKERGVPYLVGLDLKHRPDTKL